MGHTVSFIICPAQLPTIVSSRLFRGTYAFYQLQELTIFPLRELCFIQTSSFE